tara:strand:+ start:1464 stop:2426 length:963 start_codon:yes stop_codon:yes gene_type:complete
MYDNRKDVYLALGDDDIAQKLWAKEKGLKAKSLQDILLAQIEEFKPDVFYTNDPIIIGSSIVKRFPSCVKKSIAWRASLMGDLEANDLSDYNLVVSNFKTINEEARKKFGLRTAWFSPSWDPEMRFYARNKDRPCDIYFGGSYRKTRGIYDERIESLNKLSKLSRSHHVEVRLMYRKISRLRSRGIFRWIPIPNLLQKNLRRLNKPPVYGREMFERHSKAKIIVNPATDLAGNIRGNMRCWEALGCGSLMIATEGDYPDGFISGENFVAYKDVSDMEHKIKELLLDDDKRTSIAENGYNMISKLWTKERQWNDFKSLVEL